MLPPEALDAYPTLVLNLFADLEAELRARAAVGLTQEKPNVRADLAAVSKAHERKIVAGIATTYTDASRAGLLSDEGIYAAARVAGLVAPYAPLAKSDALDRLLREGLATASDMLNIVRIGAEQAVSREFVAALDSATISIASGVVDPQSAIRTAVDKVLRGQSVVSYVTKDGTRVEQNVYGAVRRAVLTGVNQTTLRMQEARLTEIGADYVEVTAHMGARPEHAVWQGQVYRFDELPEKTGYGTGAGLGGWNCRHSWFPYFPGIMEPLDPAAIPTDEENEAAYALSQRQREAERHIRQYQARTRGYSGVARDATDKGTRDWAKAERDRNKALADKWRAEADRVSKARSGARRRDREVGRAAEA